MKDKHRKMIKSNDNMMDALGKVWVVFNTCYGLYIENKEKEMIKLDDENCSSYWIIDSSLY